MAWEKHATAIVNARSAAALTDALRAALADASDHRGVSGAVSSGAPATVLVARDTRPSGPSLAAAVVAGASALGAVVHDLGELTTPALHLAVYDTAAGTLRVSHEQAFGAHVDRLANGYVAMMAHAQERDGKGTTLVLDCANGVGAAVAAAVAAHPGVTSTGLTLRLVNTNRSGLNALCGADFVHKKRISPAAAQPHDTANDGDAHWASLDGDADRLVFYQPSIGDITHSNSALPIASLLDGDKTMCLLALHTAALIRTAGMAAELFPLAAVQTAYANGGSAAFLTTSLGGDVIVVTTPTGVKHLHAAAEHHHVALYWEANGHGSILFSAKAREAIAQAAAASGDAGALAAARQLAAIDAVTNPAVGDGVSTALLVEAILRCRGMSVSEWNALYDDVPCCHVACRVADRSAVRTAPGDERMCVAPAGMQDAVDAAVKAAGPKSRAFVRASGTEDIVRVYAEAASDEAAHALARQVARAVHALAAGVGDAP